jgi:hypothetical protein
LAGNRLPGSCSEAVRLGRRGGPERDHERGLRRAAPASAERNDDDGGDDDRRRDGHDRSQAAWVPSPHRQADDRRRVRSLLRCRLVHEHRAGLGLVRGWKAKLRPRLDHGLGLSRRMGLANWEDLGGGSVPGVRKAIGLGPLLIERCHHGGDRPGFQVGWRLDVRGKELDDPADLAVLIDDALAIAAAGQMPVKLGPPGRGQVAEDEVEGLRVGQLDIPLRKHPGPLAGWRARLAVCCTPSPCGT